MAIVRPFKGIRPSKDLVSQVISKPYDVLSSSEARELAKDNPNSFLHVIKAEIDLPEDVNVYDESVYLKAQENFNNFLKAGIMVQDESDCLYVYKLTMGDHSQTGIIGCSSVDDYLNNVIKKHEYTRPEKELDRINHIKKTGIQSGLIFLSYRFVDEITAIIQEITREDHEYDFTTDDQVRHVFWVVSDEAKVRELTELFKTRVPSTYIADGHHRVASSSKVALELRENDSNYSGDEEYNFFLSCLFPDDHLNIMAYNRVVQDLNGNSTEEFLKHLDQDFDISEMENGSANGGDAQEHVIKMYIENKWYKLKAKPTTYNEDDPIKVLDVTILQDYILNKLLNIKDPRTDSRVDFIGGIRGDKELKRLVDEGQAQAAFSLNPVTMDQLITIADEQGVMPPKSTWFEPKLRSGLVVHKIN